MELRGLFQLPRKTGGAASKRAWLRNSLAPIACCAAACCAAASVGEDMAASLASVLVPCFTASWIAPRSLTVGMVRPRLCSAAIARSRMPVPSFARTVKMKKGGGTKSKTATRIPYIEIEDPACEGWKLDPVVEILREGGLGVIPTDTCYMFVTPVDSREGVQRIYTIKEVESYKKKPLTLLCKDISQISQYTTAINFKSTFKMLKALLPGSYTFIFTATNDVPRMVMDHKNRSKKTWKRSEIGVRVPAEATCLEIIQQLGKPLLCTGVPRNEEPGSSAAGARDNYGSVIDFVVDAGVKEDIFSTVVDWTSDEPKVLREGAGSLEMLGNYMDLD